MSCPLIITPEAEADMEQAFRWYQAQRIGLGADFITSVEKVFDRIRGSFKNRGLAPCG